MKSLTPEVFLALVTTGVGVFWTVIQLFTNSKMAEVILKLETTNGLIKAHIASDEEKHKSLDYQTEQHDRRLDRLEDRIKS